MMSGQTNSYSLAELTYRFEPSINTETTDEAVPEKPFEQELPEQVYNFCQRKLSKKIGIQALGDLVNKVRRMKKKVTLELPDANVEREIVTLKRKRKKETKNVMLSSGAGSLKSANARKEHIKRGNKGRVVNILHEGSGNFQDDKTHPNRSPCYLDEMTDDEGEIILNRVEENGRSVRSIQTQTEPVLIFTSEDEIEQAFRKPPCVCKEQKHVLEEINNKKLEQILEQSSAHNIEKNAREVCNHFTDTEPELKVEKVDETTSLPHNKMNLHEDTTYTLTIHNETNSTIEIENIKPDELTIIVKQEPDEEYESNFEVSKTFEHIYKSASKRCFNNVQCTLEYSLLYTIIIS